MSGYGPFMGEGDTARRSFTVLKPYRAPQSCLNRRSERMDDFDFELTDREREAVAEAARLVGGKNANGAVSVDAFFLERFPEVPFDRRVFLLREAQAHAKASGRLDAQGRIPGAR